jgi:hypothetical protein
MSSRRGATIAPSPPKSSVDHFREYADLMVFDDGTRRGLEDWQLELAADLFDGFRRNLWIIPEGNGKSTLVSLLALYGADYTESPWIPIGAASAKQARIIHDQATGFIERTPGMEKRFRSFGGYLRIKPLPHAGRGEAACGIGIEVFAHDPKTGDGVIPYPFALLDELHRHPDMRLWEWWAGKSGSGTRRCWGFRRRGSRGRRRSVRRSRRPPRLDERYRRYLDRPAAVRERLWARAHEQRRRLA